MAGKRIDSVIEKTPISKEFEFMESHLDKIATQIKSMPQIKQLFENADSVKKVTDAQKQLKGSTDDLAKINKQIEDSEKKIVALRSEEAKKLAELKVQTQQLNKENVLLAKNVLGITSEYDKFKKSVEEAQKLAKNKQLAAEVNPALQGDADKAIAKAKQMSDRLREIDQKVGDFRSNVGNYANSLAAGFDKVADEIKKVKDRNQELQTQFQNLTGRTEIKGFSQGNQFDPEAAAKISNITNEYNRNNEALQQLNKTAQIGYQTQGNLGQQVKQSQKAFENMSASGAVSEEFLKDFAKFTAEARDQLMDLRGEVKALSSDTYVFDQISSVVQTLTGAFQIGASVATLFGASEKDVQKNIQKLLVIQNVANGVQQIANQLTLRGSVLNKAYAFTQGLVTTAFNSSATAAQRFQASLGFIGIALAVIGSIALAIYEMSKNTEEAASQTKFLTQAMEDANGEYATAVKQVQSLKINLDLAKQGFVDKKSVIKEYNETLGKTTGSVKTLDEVEKALTKNAAAYVEATLLKAAANLVLEEAAKKTIEIEKNTQKELVNEVFQGSEARKAALIKSQNDPEYQKLIQEGNELILKSGTSDKQTEAEKKAAANSLKVSREKFAAAKAIEDNYFKESLNSTLIAEQKKDEEIATGLLKRLGELKNKFNFKDPNEKDDKSKENDKKFYAGRLELQKDIFAKIAGAEDAFIADRIAARKAQADIEARIIFGQANVEVENAKGDVDKINAIREKQSVDLQRIAINRNSDILALENDFYTALANNAAEGAKLLVEQQKGLYDQQIQDAKDKFNDDTLDTEQYYAQLAELNDTAYRQGKKSAEDYAKDKKKIQQDLTNALLEIEIKYTENLILIRKRQGGDTTEDEKALLELKKKLREEDVDNYADFAKQLADINKKIVDDHKKALDELGESLQQTFVQIFGGIFDAQVNKIRDQIDLIEELKAKDIERASASTESEEKKAARIKIIEAKAQVDREALERRQRKIEHDKAVFERAFKAFQITTTGIESVAKIKLANVEINTMLLRAIASGNPALIAAATAAKALAASQIPISIATTASQLVALFAAPIPKFKTGTKSSPQGLAEVAEEGPELAIEPRGSVKLFDKHSLQYLMKGTQIFPANVTKNIIANAETQRTGLLRSFNNNVNVTVQDNRDLLQTSIKELKKLNEKPTKVVIINERDITSTAYYQQQMK